MPCHGREESNNTQRKRSSKTPPAHAHHANAPSRDGRNKMPRQHHTARMSARARRINAGEHEGETTNRHARTTTSSTNARHEVSPPMNQPTHEPTAVRTKFKRHICRFRKWQLCQNGRHTRRERTKEGWVWEGCVCGVAGAREQRRRRGSASENEPTAR